VACLNDDSPSLFAYLRFPAERHKRLCHSRHRPPTPRLQLLHLEPDQDMNATVAETITTAA
jgi:hypothetical protein